MVFGTGILGITKKRLKEFEKPESRIKKQ